RVMVMNHKLEVTMGTIFSFFSASFFKSNSIILSQLFKCNTSPQLSQPLGSPFYTDQAGSLRHSDGG
ncbi:hypothetical protein, partial [Brevibacillus agri]|uniref:hypothetical protein n=1 Tax=Brevibacillus agri TaxID=51101 RepID=UPI003D25B644